MYKYNDTRCALFFLTAPPQYETTTTTDVDVRNSYLRYNIINGGKLREPYRSLRVIGLPGNLPEAITIDIAKLRIGQSIRVADLNPEGIEFLEPANAVVVAVKMARGAAADDADEDEAEGEEAAAEGDAPAEEGGEA